MDVIAQVSLNPDRGALPGGEQLQQLTNGLGGWALLGCLAVLLVGAVAWGVGSLGRGNAMAVSGGKNAVGVALVAAMVIGAAAALINFFFTTGGAV